MARIGLRTIQYSKHWIYQVIEEYYDLIIIYKIFGYKKFFEATALCILNFWINKTCSTSHLHMWINACMNYFHLQWNSFAFCIQFQVHIIYSQKPPQMSVCFGIPFSIRSKSQPLFSWFKIQIFYYSLKWFCMPGYVERT